jgi:hypothetical protein
MPIDNLNHLPQRQNRHAVRMILDARHIDLNKLLAISNTPPANRGERLDGGGAEILEKTGLAENSCGRNSILSCAEPGVESWVGFEHERGDIMLGETQGQDETAGAGAGDDELFWSVNAPIWKLEHFTC